MLKKIRMLKIHNLTKSSGYMGEVKQGGRHLLDSNQFE